MIRWFFFSQFNPIYIYIYIYIYQTPQLIFFTPNSIFSPISFKFNIYLQFIHIDPNVTPTSSRNRSRRAGTPQEEQHQGTGYIPQFPDPNNAFQPFPYQQHIPFGGQIPYQLTYDGMVAHSLAPTNFGNPPPHTQTH